MTRKLLLVLLCLLISSSAFSYSRGTMLFLNIVPSAQLNGTAGALMSNSLYDPLATWANPAMLGRQVQILRLAAGFYPERAEWLPGFNLSDVRYSARALSVGSNAGDFFDHRPSRFFVGLSYSEAFLDLGETQFRNQYNESLGSARNWERVQGLTLAGSYNRPVQISFGITLKRAVSHLGTAGEGSPHIVEAAGFANDFGVLASFPIKPRKPSTIVPFLTPTVGYAMTNVGAQVRYDERMPGDPLPRTARVSLSAVGGFNMPNAHGDWHLVQLEYAVQGQDELITIDNHRGDYHYQWFTGDINVVGDLLLGQGNGLIEKQRGWEIGVLDMLLLRGGSFEDAGDKWKYTTEGFSFRLYGLLQALAQFSPEQEADATWGFVLNHIDFVYSESRLRQGQNDVYYRSVIDGTAFRQVSLFIR